MAYQPKYFLKRVIQVQDSYRKHEKNGAPDTWIYKNVIEPQYHISMSTFRKYLTISARRQLRELLENED